MEKNLSAPPAGCYYLCKIKVFEKAFSKSLEKNERLRLIANLMIMCGSGTDRFVLQWLTMMKYVSILRLNGRHYHIESLITFKIKFYRVKSRNYKNIKLTIKKIFY